MGYRYYDKYNSPSGCFFLDYITFLLILLTIFFPIIGIPIVIIILLVKYVIHLIKEYIQKKHYPDWDQLDIQQSTKALLKKFNGKTYKAKNYAQNTINTLLSCLSSEEDIGVKSKYFDRTHTKHLANIDKWNSILLTIEEIEKEKEERKKKVKAQTQLILTIIIVIVTMFAIPSLLCTTSTTNNTNGNNPYNFTSSGLSEKAFKEMLDTMKFFNESITPISSSLRVGNSISTTAYTVTQTMTISELYKKAHDRGVLKSGLTEEQFTKQISTDDGLRSFYNYATTKGGMKFHPYDEFKQRIGWEKEFAHSRCESKELKQMLLLSDSIETYRDIDEEYYNHPIVHTPIKTSVASSVPKHKTTQTSEKMVYICTGPSAYRYHSRSSCRGLNRCSDEIERITISEAHDLGRTPCGYCY